MSADAGSEAKPRTPTVRRPRDMIISLAVLLVPIGVAFIGWRFLAGGQDVSAVDVTESYAEAERAGLDVVEPEGLGDDWVPISQVVDSSKDDATLRVGYVSPDDAGFQLVESNLPSAKLLNEELGDKPKQTGETEHAGRDWDIFKTVDGNNAYVFTGDNMSIVVYGAAEVEDLDVFVEALD